MLTRKQLLKVVLYNQSIYAPKLKNSSKELERYFRTAFYAGRRAAWEFHKNADKLKRVPPEYHFGTNPGIQRLLVQSGVCPPKGRCKCP